MASSEQGVEESVRIAKSGFASHLEENRELRALLETSSLRPSTRAQEGA